MDGGGNYGNGIPSVQNIYDWQADRGISACDHPLINTISVVWTLPVGKGQRLLPNANRVLNVIIGGWQATGIVLGCSGDPLNFAYNPPPFGDHAVSPLTSVDGRNSCRPNISGPAVASNKSYQQYFNVADFSTPPPTPPSGSTVYNSFGNMPRNSVRGYDYWDVDMGLNKDFALTERYRLQPRAEAFNIFNHTNFSDPNTILPNLGVPLSAQTAGTFGQITWTLPARELQVAAKIIF